ncbi:hypothetical protein KKG31_07580 [Patescibacteria group bacterium]|nr:hypothetical protein [Patescibacteria group bacterium]
MVNSVNGNVGIGTGTPAYTFDVNGTGRFVNGLLVSGNVGIGTTTVPTAKLQVAGTFIV